MSTQKYPRETVVIVNDDTGAISKKVKWKVVNNDPYFQLYQPFLSAMANLPPIALKLAIWCGFNTNDNGVVAINAMVKEDLGIKWKVKPGCFPKNIDALLSEGVLKRIKRGTFQVNPLYIWKGNKSDRLKEL